MARKLYPYVTAEQRKQGLAPAMGAFIGANKSELSRQGTAALKGVPGRMSRKQSSGGLNKSWGKAEKRGLSARNIGKYVEKHGGSRGSAKKALVGAHSVAFGADPRSR